MANATETDIKKEIKDYLAMRDIFNFPVLQGVGAYKGIPDRLMHYQGEVVYLEVKTPNGRQSQSQMQFQEQCIAEGIHYWVVRSIEELDKLLAANFPDTVRLLRD